MQQCIRSLTIFALCLFGAFIIAGPSAIAQTTDSLFLDADLAPDSTVESVADDLQKIVVLCAAPDQSPFVRLMSLNGASGEQIGQVVNVDLPPSPCVPPDPIFPPEPIRVMYSKYFMPGDIMVLHANHVISREHILLSRGGSPQFDSWKCIPQMIDPSEISAATAIGEMPGGAFSDGKPRLLIGTETGQIVVLVMSAAGGLIVENIIANLVPPEPIKEIEPILMASGDIHAGIGTGVDIYGLLDIDAGAASPRIAFHLIPEVGDEVLVADFGFFHDPFSTIPPDDTHEFIITDGTTAQLTLASFPSNATGRVTYSIIQSVPPEPVVPISHIAIGSLLMVATDGSGVYYDPAFDSLSGPSGCSLEITDPDPSGCNCCIGATGNADGDPGDVVDVGDLTHLIGFLFLGGPDPACPDEGNIDGVGGIDVGDLTALIAFLFLGGANPSACP